VSCTNVPISCACHSLRLDSALWAGEPAYHVHARAKGSTITDIFLIKTIIIVHANTVAHTDILPKHNPPSNPSLSRSGTSDSHAHATQLPSRETSLPTNKRTVSPSPPAAKHCPAAGTLYRYGSRHGTSGPEAEVRCTELGRCWGDEQRKVAYRVLLAGRNETRSG
jgi:hypothetical protein